MQRVLSKEHAYWRVTTGEVQGYFYSSCKFLKSSNVLMQCWLGRKWFSVLYQSKTPYILISTHSLLLTTTCGGVISSGGGGGGVSLLDTEPFSLSLPFLFFFSFSFFPVPVSPLSENECQCISFLYFMESCYWTPKGNWCSVCISSRLCTVTVLNTYRDSVYCSEKSMVLAKPCFSLQRLYKST